MLHYSFIKHPILGVINSPTSYIPGIEEAYAIYCNQQKELIAKQYMNEKLSTLNFRNKTHIVQQFRKDKLTFSWMRSEMLPFSNQDSKKEKQLTLADESDNNYLVLKYLSPFDQLYDVIILKISNASMFGVTKNNQLDTIQKATIGNLLYNSIKTRLKDEYANYETHLLVLKNLKIQKATLDQLKEDNLLLESNYKKSLSEYIDNIIREFNNDNGITIAISEEAREVIVSKKLPIEQLNKTITNAAHMAMNMNLNFEKTLLIEPEHILIEEELKKDSKTFKNDKYNHVIDILDRYEIAAKKAHSRDWKINGQTVAELCDPPVTPSAITFNLKKYKKSINTLLERYDDKWPVLRTYFKPLRNVVEKGSAIKNAI